MFTAPDGTAYRPSMFVTLTLDSYGKLRPGRGVPVRPDRYDYRRAALDALHFAKLMDRWFQNLRRSAGYRVQYFGAIEAQMRLAPHFHVALRGAIPRATLKAVTAATYVALWWPQMDTVVYEHRTPLWDDGQYRDPDTGYPLPTWEQALDDIDDPDAQPAHVVAFGRHAPLLLKAGVPVHVVAARLGHADPAISLRLWAHVLRDQAVEVPQIFAAVVDQPADSDQLVLANPLANRPDGGPGPEAASR